MDMRVIADISRRYAVPRRGHFGHRVTHEPESDTSFPCFGVTGIHTDVTHGS